MKATMDIPDELYRQVKAKSALEGRCVREIAVTLFDAWIQEKRTTGPEVCTETTRKPTWFGRLHHYAERAKGHHDMDHIRGSIFRGRKRVPE